MVKVTVKRNGLSSAEDEEHPRMAGTGVYISTRRREYSPKMGSGGPAGTLAHVERAAAARTCLGATRAMGRAMACIFAESGE